MQDVQQHNAACQSAWARLWSIRQTMVGAGLLMTLLAGCDRPPDEPAVHEASRVSSTDAANPDQRWYTQAQVEKGAPLYQAHCAVCHKENAEGTADWRTRDSSGNFPPPPLNGTAHAWHHPLSVLRMSVRNGGAPVGGVMPAFGDKLDAGQIDAVLAWVQSHWSEEIYDMWLERERQSSGG